jgi:hypothetical protein
MITYKAIIQYFDVMCARHQQINSFTYGEIDLFDKDKFTKYPALHLTPTGTAIDDQTITYGFDVVVFDRYNTNTNKMMNEASCLSDALLILQDVCKELTKGKYFINEDTNISMDLPIIAQPFIDTEPDNCSGWTTSFEVITPNEVSACNIPYYNPERQHHTEVYLPSSAPSTNYAWYSTMAVGQKSTFNAQSQLTSLVPFADTLAGSDTLTLNGTGITFDRVANAFKVSDSDPSADTYLEGEFRSQNGVFFIKLKDFGRYGYSNQENDLMTFGDNDEIKVQTKTDGTIEFFKVGVGGSVTTPYAVLPTNGTNADTQHKRIQSLTMALEFTSTAIKLYFVTDGFDIVSLSETFDMTNQSFRIGAKGSVQYSDFYFQEFFMTTESMTTQEIADTLQWLNYR